MVLYGLLSLKSGLRDSSGFEEFLETRDGSGQCDVMGT